MIPTQSPSEKTKQQHPRLKNTAVALMLGGGGIMVLGALVMQIPGGERLVAVVAGAGCIIAVLGVGLRFLGQKLKNTSIALTFSGAAAIASAAVMIAIPRWERAGVALASVGMMILAAGLVLGKRPVVGLGPAAKLSRWFLRALAVAFLLATIKGASTGAVDLYDCSRLSDRLGISIVELIHQSLGHKRSTLLQHPDIYATAHGKCLFGALQLIAAAACALFFIAVLRDLKSRPSGDDNVEGK